MRAFSPNWLWITRFAPISRYFTGLSAWFVVILYGVSACALHERFLLFVPLSNYAGILHRKGASQNMMQSERGAVVRDRSEEPFRRAPTCASRIPRAKFLHSWSSGVDAPSGSAATASKGFPRRCEKAAKTCGLPFPPETYFNVNYRIQH